MRADQSPYPNLPATHEGNFRYVTLSRDFDVTMNWIDANVTIPPHRHDQDVYNLVLAGSFVLTRNDEEKRYGVGEWLFIPAGEEHAAATVGEVQLLELWRKR